MVTGWVTLTRSYTSWSLGFLICEMQVARARSGRLCEPQSTTWDGKSTALVQLGPEPAPGPWQLTVTPGLGLPQGVAAPLSSGSAHHSKGRAWNHSSIPSHHQNCTHLFPLPGHWVDCTCHMGHVQLPRGAALPARLCPALNADPKDWPDSGCTRGWGGAWGGGQRGGHVREAAFSPCRCNTS